ncbi:MAG TPA: hypothetical protein ENK35_07870 [Candidatus Tenderia sp.]|nr:hypothetical protein [Candidatus Tenderia sp.]
MYSGTERSRPCLFLNTLPITRNSEKSMKINIHKPGAVSTLLMMPFLLGSLAGCITTKEKADPIDTSERPDWLLNTPVERNYLYGVGSAEIFGGNQASALSRAKDFARLELVKQIEVNVSGSVEQEISETVKNNTTNFTQNLSQTVSSKVPEFKLSHVVAVDSFHDKKHRQIASLVKLDVNAEKTALAQQIASLDQQLEEIARKLKTSTASGMTRLRMAAPALIIADQRAGLQARFNQLDPSQGASPLIPGYIKDLINEIYQMIGNIKVSITPEGASNRALQTGLTSQLTSKGITISAPGAGDIEVSYSLKTNTIMKDGTAFAFTEGDIWIKDEKGRVVSAVKAKAKGASASPEVARTRSIEKLSNQLGTALLNSLFK